MVKIEASKGKVGESFVRIFGNEQMGLLLSKLQSAVIRSGFELEQMISAAIHPNLHTTLDNLDDAVSPSTAKPQIQVIIKPSRPDPDNPKKSIQADLLIVDNVNRSFSLIEVKDGYVFDTKKSDGELASLKNITSWLAQEFPYSAHYYICAFNQEDKDAIVQGTKKRFTTDHVMTGRELCEKIGINYDEIRAKREIDQRTNRRYFLNQLLQIPEIRAEVMDLLDK
jgi:hypothetical protein